MPENHRRIRITVACLLFLALLLSTGCRQQAPKKPSAQNKSPEKPPAALEQMNTHLSDLGGLLKKRYLADLNSQMNQARGVVQPKQETAKQTAQSGSSGTQKTQNKGQAQPAPKTVSKQDSSSTQGTSAVKKWDKEDKLVQALHTDWNQLEPKAAVKGLPAAIQQKLEAQLSSLTQAVFAGKVLESSIAANQVYRYFAEVSALFPGPVPADLPRLRYHIIESDLMSESRMWPDARNESTKGLALWRSLTYAMPSVGKKDGYQMEHAMIDLDNAVGQQDPDVTRIKAQIALKNLDKIEKQAKSSLKR